MALWILFSIEDVTIVGLGRVQTSPFKAGVQCGGPSGLTAIAKRAGGNCGQEAFAQIHFVPFMFGLCSL